MAKLKKKITIHIDAKDIKVRSPFANMIFSGCGAHKSAKDYNRQAEKLKIKKLKQCDYED